MRWEAIFPREGAGSPTMVLEASILMPYASRTGTLRNIEAMRRAGWRMLCEPSQLKRYKNRPPPLPYALDNGAWGCHQRGVPFDEEGFLRLLDLYGENADWIVVPDIVAGGLASLDFSLGWVDRVRAVGSPLLAVQDGMTSHDVRDIVGPSLGLFLGGSTEWKLETMRSWGRLALELGAYFHVARVNTVRRITLCQDAGAHSFDGTSVTRFAVNLPRLDQARRQGYLFSRRSK